MTLLNNYLYSCKELPAGVGIPPAFVFDSLRACDQSFNLLWNNFGKRWEVWAIRDFYKPYIFTSIDKYPVWRREIGRIQQTIYINRIDDPFKWVKREQDRNKEKRDKDFSGECQDIAQDNKYGFMRAIGNPVLFPSASVSEKVLKKEKKKNGRPASNDNKRKAKGKSAVNAGSGR